MELVTEQVLVVVVTTDPSISVESLVAVKEGQVKLVSTELLLSLA